MNTAGAPHEVFAPQHLVRAVHSWPVTTELLVNDDSRSAESSARWLRVLNGTNDYYLASPNTHELRAYNHLASMARGEFIVLLQGDWFFPPQDTTWPLRAIQWVNHFMNRI